MADVINNSFRLANPVAPITVNCRWRVDTYKAGPTGNRVLVNKGTELHKSVLLAEDEADEYDEAEADLGNEDTWACVTRTTVEVEPPVFGKMGLDAYGCF